MLYAAYLLEFQPVALRTAQELRVMMPLLGVAFFPRTDAGQFVVNLKSPSGTRIEVSSQDVAKVEALIRSSVEPRDLDGTVSNIGGTAGSSGGYPTNAGARQPHHPVLCPASM